MIIFTIENDVGGFVGARNYFFMLALSKNKIFYGLFLFAVGVVLGMSRNPDYLNT